MYTILFLIFGMLLLVGSLYLYFKDDSTNVDELNDIMKNKVCPKCGEPISLNKTSGGCSGADTFTVNCKCGYNKRWVIPSSGCGIH